MSQDLLSKRVVFDTNALFRFWVRVLITELADVGALQPFWSKRTEVELRQVLRTRGQNDAEAFLKTQSSARLSPGPATLARIRVEKFRDQGDLHVVAAALEAQASIIVTDNARDFPSKHLRPLGLARYSVDGFFAEVLDILPQAATQQDLLHSGLPRTAKRLIEIRGDRE